MKRGLLHFWRPTQEAMVADGTVQGDPLDQYRLDAEELAALDGRIAALGEDSPDPAQLLAAMFAAQAEVTVDISQAVLLLAMFRECPAAEAQEELFQAVATGQLGVSPDLKAKR